MPQTHWSDGSWSQRPVGAAGRPARECSLPPSGSAPRGDDYKERFLERSRELRAARNRVEDLQREIAKLRRENRSLERALAIAHSEIEVTEAHRPKHKTKRPAPRTKHQEPSEQSDIDARFRRLEID